MGEITGQCTGCFCRPTQQAAFWCTQEHASFSPFFFVNFINFLHIKLKLDVFEILKHSGFQENEKKNPKTFNWLEKSELELGKHCRELSGYLFSWKSWGRGQPEDEDAAGWISVLGLVGMELIFFRAACTVLCFRFVAKTVWITHQRFSRCWAELAQLQGLLCFSLYCPRE